MKDVNHSSFKQNGNLEDLHISAESSLLNATLISLFSDQRTDSARGFWADPELGSKLWTLERGKLNLETKELAIQYARDALTWMINSGIAKEIRLEGEISGESINLNISISQDSGPPRSYSFPIHFNGMI